MNHFFLKKYEPAYHSKVVELYQSLKEKYVDFIYWWPGKESFTWNFCDCAFIGDKFIGKGQVQPIAVMEEGDSHDLKHKIFINIKIHPDYEKETEIYQILYESLYKKALKIKDSLPTGFGCLLCVGNFREEEENNAFYLANGFKPLNSLYGMARDLSEEMVASEYPLGIEVRHWQMNQEEEQLKYLRAEKEIWPDNPLGLERLLEFKRNPNWTAITAFDGEDIVGSVMAWEDLGEQAGVIEDLFVKEAYRKSGLGRYLLVAGLTHLQSVELKEAQLEVVTDNDKALNLYRSAGFKEISEEKRFYIELK
ncbi:GNAT family N-acetyltransferase [Heyndrickxia shackletonii]|uniref:GNAT family N-acetyltransferase n=1 Tax=Heyndrickxia shackletonii TaxID=157838 RepID=UPI0006EC17C3|nr:GNAT family N-acetyltransferase [Heyndrickxia shackletonii]NEZ00193.1 GNAT family N-acetyltransferase [Heyndrickxia shackletonii]